MSWQSGPALCYEQNPHGDFVCTKPKNHDGPHVAMGGQSTEPLASWPNRAPKVNMQARQKEAA